MRCRAAPAPRRAVGAQQPADLGQSGFERRGAAPCGPAPRSSVSSTTRRSARAPSFAEQRRRQLAASTPRRSAPARELGGHHAVPRQHFPRRFGRRAPTSRSTAWKRRAGSETTSCCMRWKSATRELAARAGQHLPDALVAEGRRPLVAQRERVARRQDVVVGGGDEVLRRVVRARQFVERAEAAPLVFAPCRRAPGTARTSSSAPA